MADSVEVCYFCPITFSDRAEINQHCNLYHSGTTLVTIWIPNTWILDSSEYRTVWLSDIQMVKSRDLADHSNTGHFGPWTGFFQYGFQTTIWIPDHLTAGHKSTIQTSLVFRWLLHSSLELWLFIFSWLTCVWYDSYNIISWGQS